LTGEGDGDDEIIDIELEKLSDKVYSIWPVITVYTTGKTFNNVSGAFCRILDSKTHKEFCHFNLSNNRDGKSNGNIMGVLRRCGDK
jgi:tellurium resistance protein TerZ